LCVGFTGPSATDVWSTIAQDNIDKGIVGLSADSSSALSGGNVSYEGFDSPDGFDGDKVDGNDEAADGHVLDGDLTPTSWSSTEIDHSSTSREEVILAIELDELECSTGTVPVEGRELSACML